MKKPPLAILITASSMKSGESDILTDLFEAGLERLHLRKPDASPAQVRKLLDSIAEKHHKKIVVHRFPELLNDFSLGGYHHYAGESLFKTQGTTSRSLHSLGELKNISEPLDYCFLDQSMNPFLRKDMFLKFQCPN